MFAPGPGRTRADSPFGGRLAASSDRHGTNLTLTGAPAETQVLVAAPGTPTAVSIDGRRVAPAASLEALRAARSGWIISDGRLVLKLNPRHGHARVRIGR